MMDTELPISSAVIVRDQNINPKDPNNADRLRSFLKRRSKVRFDICRFQAVEEAEESKIVRIAMKWKGHFDAINLEIIAGRDLREKVREANRLVKECPAVSEWVKARLSGSVTLREKVKDLLNSEWMP